MYNQFSREFTFCWACGWDGSYGSTIARRLERAHIVGGSGGSVRGADRRDITMLCKRCHRLAHGDTYRVPETGLTLPNMTQGNLVWLKLYFDVEYLDIEYLNELSTGIVDDPIKPDEWFISQNRHIT